MNESEFNTLARQKGYAKPEVRRWTAEQKGLHRHQQSVLLLVVDGSFTLELENGLAELQPGDWYELAAETLHDERVGAAGASTLLAVKPGRASG